MKELNLEDKLEEIRMKRYNPLKETFLYPTKSTRNSLKKNSN